MERPGYSIEEYSNPGYTIITTDNEGYEKNIYLSLENPQDYKTAIPELLRNR